MNILIIILIVVVILLIYIINQMKKDKEIIEKQYASLHFEIYNSHIKLDELKEKIYEYDENLQ